MTSRKSSATDLLRDKSVRLRKSTESILQELLELSSKSEVDAIRLLEIASAEIEKWSECLVDQRTKLDTAMKHLKGIAERQVDELEARLIPTLRAEGFTVMGDGGLIIVDGVVHIGLNLKQRTVSINDHQANNLAISFLIASLVEEVNKIKKWDGIAGSYFIPPLAGGHAKTGDFVSPQPTGQIIQGVSPRTVPVRPACITFVSTVFDRGVYVSLFPWV